MSAPKILCLDIETAPSNVYAWGLHNQNISPNQIIEPGYVLCWAAKWIGERKVHFRTLHDEDFATKAHELMEEADGIISWNGQSFDTKHLNHLFLLEGLHPPAPYVNIDLLRTWRANFKTPSNKLEFVLRDLELESKVENRGMPMWIGCMNDDPKMWREMRKYNVQDTKVLEDVYYDLQGWITVPLNHGLYINDDDPTCHNCGSKHVHSRGYQRTDVRIYRRYQCQDCGRWQRSRYSHDTVGRGVLK